jgi:ketohexokinase
MRILAVGVATLDIVNRVEAYPQEDQEIRAMAQHRRRGGNACNTLTVLSRLGHHCSWAGMLADDENSRFVLEDLQVSGIDTRLARVETGSVTPTSYIASSQATGSRTIIHYRKLSEYAAHHFSGIDLTPFDWVHFEGRNPEATLVMLQRVKARIPTAHISIELEKSRAGLERCLAYVDSVMISRAFALAKGFDEAQGLFNYIRPWAGRATVFLAWGSLGGWLQCSDGAMQFLPAHKPPEVVDTLGAGDVFNAGLIHGLYVWNDPLEALRFGIQIAGEKCGCEGIDWPSDSITRQWPL